MGTAAQVALLPSPFLGPAAWEPVAALLRSRGRSVLAGDLPEQVSAPGPVLRRWTGQIPDDAPVVLVPHSNAGLYVPALCRVRHVVGAVFVDAALPPREGVVPLVPPASVEWLRGLADAEGLLPPWTEWWDPADVAALFPDDGVRQHVEAGQPRVRVEYVGASLEAHAGWADRPGAYLGFGPTYAAERARAQRWGWPVAELDGGHLHQLVEPEAVTAVLVWLLDDLGL